jgi:hypothetical protein
MLKLDKILFIGSCVYLLGVIGWITTRDNWDKVEATTVEDSQQGFIAYLEDAVTRIESQQQTESATNVAQQPENTNKPELERVYIPLYQPPQIITQTAPPSPELPLPPPPVLPPPPGGSETMITTKPDSQINCTLIGLLESEKGAIALFDWNGAIERIEIGQQIANTGWTLKDIINDEALVEQNNQIKTIAVGKAF